MNEKNIKIQRALISVSDKTGVADFAKHLHAHGVEIISTGGTAIHLREQGIPVADVSSVTQFPEMMDGRVKTLHPLIHGGILGLRDQHAPEAMVNGIGWIDLVVVNLYPFANTLKNADVTLETAIEQIDIGGPSMIRSAAKNMGWVGVLVDHADYAWVLDELTQSGGLSYSSRRQLAAKAFCHTADYDSVIAGYLSTDRQILSLKKVSDLRYGENPHQAASLWRFGDSTSGVPGAQLLQGKSLSYNNLVDADAALSCARDCTGSACVIVKHATPCGVAVCSETDDVFAAALACDPVSAFGGVTAFNKTCTETMARGVVGLFMEVIVAPDYTPEARAILGGKPNLRVLQADFLLPPVGDVIKYIEGGLLIQSRNAWVPDAEKFRIVTKTMPDESLMSDLLFASGVVKHVKSNAIVIAKNGAAIGIGGGQVSRVDAVHTALRKAGDNAHGAVLASDAFFPFRDSIDHLAGTGICAVIQPGGSVRDNEVIAACNELSIAMVFTDVRSFRH